MVGFFSGISSVLLLLTCKTLRTDEGEVEVRVPDEFLPFCLMLQYLYTGVLDVAALPYELPEPYGPAPAKLKAGKTEADEKKRARLRHALYGADFDLLSKCLVTASRYKVRRMELLIEAMLASRKMLSSATCTTNLVTAKRMGLKRLGERSMLWAMRSIDGE